MYDLAGTKRAAMTQLGSSYHKLRTEVVSAGSLLVVSDVDGTLLAHNGEFPLPLKEMRAFLSDHGSVNGYPLTIALASSRTLRELQLLQRLLGIRGPLIAEDGGVLSMPRSICEVGEVSSEGVPDIMPERNDMSNDTDTVYIGMQSRELLNRLHTIDKSNRSVLIDMSASELASLGFRTPAVVHRAVASRSASVLLDLDHMSEQDRASYYTAAAELDVQIKRGGRWCTAVSGSDKGRALSLLRERLAHRSQFLPFTVAIGNEENDAALLSGADLPLIIRNPGRGHHPHLLAVADAHPLENEGVAGFLEMFRIIHCITEDSF